MSFEFFRGFDCQFEIKEIAAVLGSEFTVYRGTFTNNGKVHYRYFDSNQKAWECGANTVMRIKKVKDSVNYAHMTNSLGFDYRPSLEFFDHMVQSSSGAWVNRHS